MKSDLYSVPFDHFQRYNIAAGFIEASSARDGKVIEIGANAQSLLGAFLPEAEIIRTDGNPEVANATGIRYARAEALPFADREFDACVCLDVMEHIPEEFRAQAVAEMLRVARSLVVFSFPSVGPATYLAEQKANSTWKRQYKTGYAWLEEHLETGAVGAEHFEQSIRDKGWVCFGFGHGDPSLWSGLMTSHFLKVHMGSFGRTVDSFDRVYNQRVCGKDRSDEGYRHFVVALRQAAELGVLEGRIPMYPDSETRDLIALMTQLTGGLEDLAIALAAAHDGWRESAKSARRAVKQLSRARNALEMKQGLINEGRHIAGSIATLNQNVGNQMQLLSRASDEMRNIIDTVLKSQEVVRQDLADLRTNVIESKLSFAEEAHVVKLEVAGAADRAVSRVAALSGDILAALATQTRRVDISIGEILAAVATQTSYIDALSDSVLAAAAKQASQVDALNRDIMAAAASHDSRVDALSTGIDALDSDLKLVARTLESEMLQSREMFEARMAVSERQSSRLSIERDAAVRALSLLDGSTQSLRAQLRSMDASTAQATSQLMASRAEMSMFARSRAKWRRLCFLLSIALMLSCAAMAFFALK